MQLQRTVICYPSFRGIPVPITVFSNQSIKLSIAEFCQNSQNIQVESYNRSKQTPEIMHISLAFSPQRTQNIIIGGGIYTLWPSGIYSNILNQNDNFHWFHANCTNRSPMQMGYMSAYYLAHHFEPFWVTAQRNTSAPSLMLYKTRYACPKTVLFRAQYILPLICLSLFVHLQVQYQEKGEQQKTLRHCYLKAY